ncbi:MAG: ATP-dependent DNA helicase RecG, partial [Oscillospiraceae bacterium]|nr:ATP-dependent DNA helicase RecG [Oscillospiraceae bacterium]
MRYLPGVGENRAKHMARLGLNTCGDLICNFPRAYEDRRRECAIKDLFDGDTACVRAMVATVPKLSRIRKGLDLVKLRVVDESSSMNITFFNQAWQRDALKPGDSYVFYGKVSLEGKLPSMTNPVYDAESGPRSVTGKIVPVYRLTSGISQGLIMRSTSTALKRCIDEVEDHIPERIRREYGLASLTYAYEK